MIYKDESLPLEERKLAFLEDTRKYYEEDPNRRCVTENNMCYYSPIAVGKEGISAGCAIGTHLEPDTQVVLDKYGSVACFYETEIWDLIPSWMNSLGIDFLQSIQSFHDTPLHWDEKGLTAEGESFYKRIKQKIYEE